MEENRDQQKLYGLLQMTVYLIVMLDIFIHLYRSPDIFGVFANVLDRLNAVPIFSSPLNAKLFTLLMVCIVGVGTLARKQLDLDPKLHIVYPLAAGLLLMFSSIILLKYHQTHQGPNILPYTDWFGLAYIFSSFLGAILTLTSIDNISKLIKSGFGKDKWNVEEESFMQDTEIIDSPYMVNIPTRFYYRKKVRLGFLNVSVFKGCMVLGNPGSGKTFGFINPAIRQLIGLKSFTGCIYDYKFPDLAKIAYYHFLLARQQGRIADYKFHIINLNDVSKSRRVNPLKPEYVRTLAEASEIAEALVEAMKKGDKSGGADQFFTQSAINFLAACVYFLAKYEDGKYSTFAHVLSFLNRSYEEIFNTLFTNQELESLLSPFYSAFSKKAYDQLEGQIGTLKIFISRLATKESYWIFSAEDFNLKISDRRNPSILILANDPSTQNINSALYSLVLNRMTTLVNTKGNLPTCIIADELPTLYAHRLDNILAVARSNRVGVVLGLQELPLFRQRYGKETADSICAIVGNILSGSVRDKSTLDWLERLFGKIKQTGESLSVDRSKTSVSFNERLEALIPAGKIASLRTGEMVGIVSKDVEKEFTGEYKTSAVHCRINLDMEAIKKEERNYPDMPVYYDFKGRQEEILTKNFMKINGEVKAIVESIMDGI